MHKYSRIKNQDSLQGAVPAGKNQDSLQGAYFLPSTIVASELKKAFKGEGNTTFDVWDDFQAKSYSIE